MDFQTSNNSQPLEHFWSKCCLLAKPEGSIGTRSGLKGENCWSSGNRSLMTRCPSQRAYARCDGQLAGFAAGTARHRADDGGRLFDGDDADNCGLRLPRLLSQSNFVNGCRWQVAKDDGACRPLARTCHRSALATVSPPCKPHTQTHTHTHTHT